MLDGRDQQVMLPKASGASRAAQMSDMAAILHDLGTEKELGELIATLAAEVEAGKSSLGVAEQRNVQLAQRTYKTATALPKELATRIAELERIGFEKWAEAKTKDDFDTFAPVLGAHATTVNWLAVAARVLSLVWLWGRGVGRAHTTQVCACGQLTGAV